MQLQVLGMQLDSSAVFLGNSAEFLRTPNLQKICVQLLLCKTDFSRAAILKAPSNVISKVASCMASAFYFSFRQRALNFGTFLWQDKQCDWIYISLSQLIITKMSMHTLFFN